MNATKACCPAPNLATELVLDAHLTWTDALLFCASCGSYFLAGMVDIAGDDRVYRLAELEPTLVEKTLHNLSRGSCDLGRAEQEIQHLASLSSAAPFMLLLKQQSEMQTLAIPLDLTLPTGDWRSLPLDGVIVRRALASRS